MFKAFFSDKEILRSMGLIGRLAINIILTLLIFFFLGLYLDLKLNTGHTLLIIGILTGISSGIYLNYRHLKRYYEQEQNKPPTL